MMMITTTPQPCMLPAVRAFRARPCTASSRSSLSAWRGLAAELVVTADERNRYGIASANGGTTTTGNDRSFAICGMHVPAFAKKEHSQRKRPT